MKHPRPKPEPQRPLTDEARMIQLLDLAKREIEEGRIDHITVLASSAEGSDFEGSDGNGKVAAEHVVGHLQVMIVRLTSRIIGRRIKAAEEEPG